MTSLILQRTILVSVLLILSSNLFAASRNCTKEEREQGNTILLATQSSGQARSDILNRHMPFGIHQSASADDSESILYQNGYVMSHDKDLRTALWVSYRLTHEDISAAKGKDRVNCFRTDPRFDDADTAKKSDYDEPTYDQGHLANDADMKDDLLEQINTYVMSNMSPQHCRFNRGIWLSLEHLTRIWASSDRYRNLLVTSGAIFNRDMVDGRDTDDESLRMTSRNGKQRVAIPSHYFKTILRQDEDGWKSISFLLKHDNDDDGVKWLEVKPDVIGSIVSIEDIEQLSGYLLHPSLNRGQISQGIDGEEWDFDEGESNFNGGIKDNNKCVTSVE